MCRILAVLCSGAVCLLSACATRVAPAASVPSPRAPAASAPDRRAIDEFVVTVRDMAAWALVTPAAHIPVAGIQDSSGYVATVVGPPKDPAAPPDSVLALFRRTLTAGVSRAKARAVGLAYLKQEIPPRATRAVNVVVVEVDSRDGYRANVVFPYTRDEEQRPVFGASFTMPGTLQAFGARRD
jgi:hypothetical protein